ncbi:MAG TPA: hypothetical protein VKZ18_19235 [Polyangia bacterium]|nr:hypothetical protein [Polyangia bacterium]
MRLPLLASLVVVGMTGGCATRFPLPMTAAELVRYDSGPALIAYLGQPDASTAVCDLRAQGPHVPAFTPDIRRALIDGLVDGKITAPLWRRCVEVALKGLPADQVPWMFDDVMRSYGKQLNDSDVETDPALADRVATMQRLYIDRRPDLDGHPTVLAPLFDELRGKLAKNKLGPVAKAFATELIATVDVEHGAWQGHPVDLPLMDTLAAAGNEMTLTRFAERLPTPELREEARRRLVRIHIALSPFDEVRADAADVEKAVIRTGHNPVFLADHPLVRAWFSEETIRFVLVRQQVWQRSATLLGYAQERPTLSVLPELSFRGSLWAELQSISHPVTLCSSKQALDPTPCLLTASVSLDNPFAYLDKGGKFHFRDNVAEQEVLPLAARDAFTLPVALDDQPAVSLQWGLRYQRPEDLDLSGAGGGGRGPELTVRVEHPNQSRYVFVVQSAQGNYAAVVEAADLAGFHLASRGGFGYTGTPGSPGSNGASGGECGSGGDGGRGGDGGPGGDGGDGGNINVVIACGSGPCDVALLKRIIFSVGGAGGAGGPGGSGGSGGSGGTGRNATTHQDSDGNTIVDDPGCTGGPSGSPGANGSDGASGRAGNPGRVTFQVVP